MEPEKRQIQVNANTRSVPSICNLAWSNSGNQAETDCTNKDYVFSNYSDRDTPAVKAGIESDDVISIAYLSVGTVHKSYPADERLVEFAWVSNEDTNSDGETWGDWWFNPDDLSSKVLPVIKDIMDKCKESGYDMISTDNAKPSSAVTDNDSQARSYKDEQRVDPRYVDYLDEIINYGEEIGLKIVLKNPEYYNNEPSIIDKFDAYIVESLFNWYPYDINLYGDRITGSKPFWIFQYEGTNGVSNTKLKERMEDRGVDMVYMDSDNGWEEFYA
eukprot:CFRG4128T1